MISVTCFIWKYLFPKTERWHNCCCIFIEGNLIDDSCYGKKISFIDCVFYKVGMTIFGFSTTVSFHEDSLLYLWCHTELPEATVE